MAHEGGITEPQALHDARVELIGELIVLTWGQLVQLVKDTGEKLPGEPCGPYLAMKAAIRAIHSKTVEKRSRPEGAAPRHARPAQGPRQRRPQGPRCRIRMTGSFWWRTR